MTENKICKVILVGESGVGKTCIIVRFVSEEYKEETISTTGASYASKIMEFKDYKKSIQFQIWDTAGQEKYRGLTKLFYKDAKIVILVYDMTRRKSFDEIKNYWYNQIKENSSEEISKIFFYKKILFI
jgi:small GTP-binding protein